MGRERNELRMNEHKFGIGCGEKWKRERWSLRPLHGVFVRGSLGEFLGKARLIILFVPPNQCSDRGDDLNGLCTMWNSTSFSDRVTLAVGRRALKETGFRVPLGRERKEVWVLAFASGYLISEILIWRLCLLPRSATAAQEELLKKCHVRGELKTNRKKVLILDFFLP